MVRKREYFGEVIELTDYEECHYYGNQKNVVDGIPLNPVLREDFDATPNEDRDPQEISDWWGKPFIRTCAWEDFEESWESYSERMARLGISDHDTEDQFSERVMKQKENWFNTWPSGTRYEVRCLDGGAWDRSTGIAMVSTLEKAVEAAKAYPSGLKLSMDASALKLNIIPIPVGFDHKALAQLLGGTIVKFNLSDVQQALYETAPAPTGNWRKYWTMKLHREPGKCRLPRGFTVKPFSV